MTSPTDIFRDSVTAMLCNVHTALPGIVKAYDPVTNKATIQPALNKNFTSGVEPMPILENVPIMFPTNIVFPVNNGDYVLLIFAERSMDLWLSVGGQVTPNDPRKFDLSDAIAIPGLMPFTQTYPNNNNQDYVISFQGSTITIKDDGDVLIKTANKVAIGKSTAELLGLFDQLLDSLIANLGLAAPYPGVVTDATAIKVLLTTIKGTIPP